MTLGFGSGKKSIAGQGNGSKGEMVACGRTISRKESKKAKIYFFGVEGRGEKSKHYLEELGCEIA